MVERALRCILEEHLQMTENVDKIALRFVAEPDALFDRGHMKELVKDCFEGDEVDDWINRFVQACDEVEIVPQVELEYPDVAAIADQGLEYFSFVVGAMESTTLFDEESTFMTPQSRTARGSIRVKDRRLQALNTFVCFQEFTLTGRLEVVLSTFDLQQYTPAALEWVKNESITKLMDVYKRRYEFWEKLELSSEKLEEMKIDDGSFLRCIEDVLLKMPEDESCTSSETSTRGEDCPRHLHLPVSRCKDDEKDDDVCKICEAILLFHDQREEDRDINFRLLSHLVSSYILNSSVESISHTIDRESKAADKRLTDFPEETAMPEDESCTSSETSTHGEVYPRRFPLPASSCKDDEKDEDALKISEAIFSFHDQREEDGDIIFRLLSHLVSSYIQNSSLKSISETIDRASKDSDKRLTDCPQETAQQEGSIIKSLVVNSRSTIESGNDCDRKSDNVINQDDKAEHRDETANDNNIIMSHTAKISQCIISPTKENYLNPMLEVYTCVYEDTSSDERATSNSQQEDQVFGAHWEKTLSLGQEGEKKFSSFGALNSTVTLSTEATHTQRTGGEWSPQSANTKLSPSSSATQDTKDEISELRNDIENTKQQQQQQQQQQQLHLSVSVPELKSQCPAIAVRCMFEEEESIVSEASGEKGTNQFLCAPMQPAITKVASDNSTRSSRSYRSVRMLPMNWYCPGHNPSAISTQRSINEFSPSPPQTPLRLGHSTIPITVTYPEGTHFSSSILSEGEGGETPPNRVTAPLIAYPLKLITTRGRQKDGRNKTSSTGSADRMEKLSKEPKGELESVVPRRESSEIIETSSKSISFSQKKSISLSVFLKKTQTRRLETCGSFSLEKGKTRVFRGRKRAQLLWTLSEITNRLIPMGAGKGEGDIFEVRSENDDILSVFKPLKGEHFHRQGLSAGQGAVREEAVYIADTIIGSQARVPVTARARYTRDGKQIAGAVQSYVQHLGIVDDIAISRDLEKAKKVLAMDDVQAIACLDMRVFNTDRHGGNLLYGESPTPETSRYVLSPIDHGCSLPPWWCLREAGFDAWYNWPQIDQKATEMTRYIAQRSFERLNETARQLQIIGIDNFAIVTFRLCTIWVKISLCDRNLTLKQAASVMVRPLDDGNFGQPSLLEQWVAESAQDSGLDVSLEQDESGCTVTKYPSMAVLTCQEESRLLAALVERFWSTDEAIINEYVATDEMPFLNSYND